MTTFKIYNVPMRLASKLIHGPRGSAQLLIDTSVSVCVVI